MSQEMTGAQQQALTKQQAEFKAALDELGIAPYQYKTIKDNFFPDASALAVVSYLRYCKGRNLDPMKRPAHIVPMWDRVKNDAGEWVNRKREVTMPGIYEYRTTAVRTGLYGGHSQPQYGDKTELFGREVPEWCAMTFYRWNPKAEEWTAFPVKVWFEEVATTVPEYELNDRGYPKKNEKGYKIPTGGQVLNARWNKAPRQMLTKCTEAAGLREAFPDEFGGEPTYEEMEAWTQPPLEPADSHDKPQRASLADRLSETKTASMSDSAGVSDSMGATVTRGTQEDEDLKAVESGSSQSEAPQDETSTETEEQEPLEHEAPQEAAHAAKKRKKKGSKKKTKRSPAPERPAQEPEKRETPAVGGDVGPTKDHIMKLMDESETAEDLAYAIGKAEALSEDEQTECRDYFRTRINELNQQRQKEIDT